MVKEVQDRTVHDVLSVGRIDGVMGHMGGGGEGFFRIEYVGPHTGKSNYRYIIAIDELDAVKRFIDGAKDGLFYVNEGDARQEHRDWHIRNKNNQNN